MLFSDGTTLRFRRSRNIRAAFLTLLPHQLNSHVLSKGIQPELAWNLELTPRRPVAIYKDAPSAGRPCPERDFIRNGNSAPVGTPFPCQLA